jgi:hypothetical protein
MPLNEIQLELTISEAETDDEELDGLTTQLLRDLRELGVESVEQASGGVIPKGAKSVEPFTLGALVLVAVPAFLPKLVEFLQAWSLRGESRKVKIRTPAGLEIEFTPEKRLSETELLVLAKKMTQIR